VENLNPYNPAFTENMQAMRSFFYRITGDPEGSRAMALQAIDNLRQQQSAAMAYLDAFWLFAVLSLLLIPLALLMKESRAAEGMHVGVE
jgi:DHA2 family multidrug resistance protein